MKFGTPTSLVLLATLFATGCGSKIAAVKGKIAYRTKPVQSGQITFINAQGSSASGTINSDGSYLVTNVPRGPVMVTVKCVEPEWQTKTDSDEKSIVSKSHVPVKYNTPETSDLKFDISSNSQTIDIELKD